MKSLIVIPLTVAVVFGIAAVVLSLAGMAVSPADPIAAGAISAAAGMVGLVPVLRTRGRDAISVVQSALAGTIFHLLTQTALAVGVIASHLMIHHGAFPFWLIGGYWTSLTALIWQLRRFILAVPNAAKIPE
ncbi:MAG TPA: hypothetical protein VHX86_04660 [Tepidisphaeraceae bacterium]|jgi:hypothetical protein|nr:hypothetical protein [Tepidisphaeraceae bacterium]